MKSLHPRTVPLLALALFVSAALAGSTIDAATAMSAAPSPSVPSPQAGPGGASNPVRTCGTPDPTPADLEGLRASLQRAREEGVVRRAGGTIQIALHVIHDGDLGNVSDSQIEYEIRELNRDYLGTGYRFSLASVDRTDRKAWFRLQPFTGEERRVKAALAIDPARRLNVYTCEPGRDLLGWSHFPFSFPEDHFMHGVVIHHGTLPGGPLAPYNLGRTLTHEVGHYLGLFHTFQGGCEEPGDWVGDTPAEATPNFACPESRNTCPSPGDDPIHNYMDYSTDECYTEFTPGQDARMDAIVPAYRPSLLDAESGVALGPDPALAAASAEAARAEAANGRVEFRGAWPNPFRVETTLRFSLPRSARVRLRVYDVAGHAVATIIDAVMPPGDHSAPFRGHGLAAGIYFATLRVDGEVFNRSLMLVR